MKRFFGESCMLNISCNQLTASLVSKLPICSLTAGNGIGCTTIFGNRDYQGTSRVRGVDQVSTSSHSTDVGGICGQIKY